MVKALLDLPWEDTKWKQNIVWVCISVISMQGFLYTPLRVYT